MSQPEVRTLAPEPGSELPYTIAFWSLLALSCAFVLSLPLFPTGDGGLHIYYATIFRDLILHRSPLYAHFYGVRHMVQPYLLHYYVFIVLRAFLAPDTAEKVIVVAILATFATGFRHMVRSLSTASPGLVLLIFPYLLNWPLSMGALNYDFALGLLFFALGAYQRLRADLEKSALWRFGALLFLFVLSHPVPLLLLLCVLAVDLLLRWRDAGSGPGTFFAGNRPRFFAFILACVAFLVPVLIADKSQVASSASDIRFHRDYLSLIYSGVRLNMFFTPGFPGKIYNRLNTLPFLISLTTIVISGFVARLRRKELNGSDRLAIFVVLFLGASLFAPFMLNGSGYFSFRLWLPCWILAIAASSGAVQGSKLNRYLALYGIALALVTLGFARHALQPVAAKAAQLEHAHVPSGKAGLFVQSSSGQQGVDLGMNYPVLWWNGGRTFITHNDVMLNSPWLYLTIIPLRENGEAGLLRDFTQQVATENPNTLGQYLARNPDQRVRALHDADFILFVEPRTQDPDVRPLISLTLGPFTPDWTCDLHGFYAVCTKTTTS